MIDLEKLAPRQFWSHSKTIGKWLKFLGIFNGYWLQNKIKSFLKNPIYTRFTVNSCKYEQKIDDSMIGIYIGDFWKWLIFTVNSCKYGVEIDDFMIGI